MTGAQVPSHGQTFWPASTRGWALFIGGFLATYAMFQYLAAVLGSSRGEFGLLIASAVLGAIWLWSRFAFQESWRTAWLGLGLAAPKAKGVLAAGLLSAAMLLAVPLSLGSAWSVFPHAHWLAAGIFLQGGLAEESLFRAYLFGRLRPGRTFGQAAWLSMIPFMAAHLYLPFTMAPAIAAASIALSVMSAFPLARLYELTGNTVWGAAILHAVIQAVPKLVVPFDGQSLFPVVWMAACALVPYVVFLFKLPDGQSRPLPSIDPSA